MGLLKARIYSCSEDTTAVSNITKITVLNYKLLAVNIACKVTHEILKFLGKVFLKMSSARMPLFVQTVS